MAEEGENREGDMHGLYARLGVPTNASDREIGKAYRRKAFEYHTDRCSLPNAK